MDIPKRRLNRVQDLDAQFQVVARRGAQGGAWDYEFDVGLENAALRVFQRWVGDGRIITHHMHTPGGGWLLIAKLAREPLGGLGCAHVRAAPCQPLAVPPGARVGVVA